MDITFFRCRFQILRKTKYIWKNFSSKGQNSKIAIGIWYYEDKNEEMRNQRITQNQYTELQVINRFNQKQTQGQLWCSNKNALEVLLTRLNSK